MEYQYRLFPALYGLALGLGLPANLVALFVFIFKITPRTSSGVYIINLAAADIAVLSTLPFRIHYHVNRNDWVFGDVACRVTGTLFHAGIYLSICFMTCICVDRYIAAVHPHTYYLSLRQSRYPVVVSVLLWGASGVAMLAFILMGPLETDHADGSLHHSCFENIAKHEWDTRMAPYSLLSLVFGSLLPSVTILVCYPLAARRIARIRSYAARGALRVIYTLLAITLFCFLPYHVVHFLHLLRHLGAVQHCPCANAIYDARRVTVVLVSFNTCLDPLLYYVSSSHCRWKGKRLWGRVRRSRGVYTIAMR